MSRTTLCLLTAGALALGSVALMVTRCCVLGDEVRRPVGPGTWRVTLAIKGTSEGNARVWAPTPLHLDRQQLIEELFTSDQLTAKPPDERSPLRRRVCWKQRGGAGEDFELKSEFLVGLRMGRPATVPGKSSAAVSAPPAAGEYLAEERLIEASAPAISETALALTRNLTGSTSLLDTAQALYHFVEKEVRHEAELDGPPRSARSCLEKRAGGRAARARLLVALLRNRNVPARLVQGLTLANGAEQSPHFWVEAYVYDHWLPMCPSQGAFGKLPSTYLVLGYGDRPVVTAKRVNGLQYAFVAEKLGREEAAQDASFWRAALKRMSLYQLPPSDRRLVEVLLLLPLAALIICVFRNLVGLTSFGLFTPALIGLAFHDLNSLPGVVVFVMILLVGWLMRRLLDGYHLLQVPRVAMMLTLIMSVLIAVVVMSNYFGATTTRYISLFPMVILTSMVERFWTQETEDGTAASFKTLFQTMLIAMVIALVLGRPFVVRHLFCFPETLGLIMAAQLLIGRYTGYRLMELWRFRDFLRNEDDDGPVGYTTTA
jgi:transglutaminase-like putative cysteine protease